jgi:hypothetical protein
MPSSPVPLSDAFSLTAVHRHFDFSLPPVRDSRSIPITTATEIADSFSRLKRTTQ